MRYFRITLLAGLLLAFGISQPAQAQDQEVTIIAFTEYEGKLSQTADALEATGLVSDLEGDDYTFFAPTDDAWSDLSEDLRGKLFDPEYRDELREVLEYQIVEGAFTTSDLKAIAGPSFKDASLKNLFGEQLQVTGATEGFLIDGAAILQPDVETANGIVHVVDTVLLPSADDSPAQAK